MLAAGILEARGHLPEGLNAYERLCTTYPSEEAKGRMALLLQRTGAERELDPSEPEFARLFAGGRWIRTSSTRAPVNRVIPLLCCPIAWDELARARVLPGSYDLIREEIWVNLIDRDRPHGL